MRHPVLQCLTLDGIALSHVEQVRLLCEAGAAWIQLRMKEADDGEAEETVAACVALCRSRGRRLVVNDRVAIALRCGADGVHLGKEDMPWAAARELAGPGFVIGGTVNSPADAEAAEAAGVLDYVGVGPFRHTLTKRKLAPVLRASDWRAILGALRGLPSYAIGGIRVEDIDRVRALGVTGAAVGGGLHAGAGVAANVAAFGAAWEDGAGRRPAEAVNFGERSVR